MLKSFELLIEEPKEHTCDDCEKYRKETCKVLKNEC